MVFVSYQTQMLVALVENRMVDCLLVEYWRAVVAVPLAVVVNFVVAELVVVLGLVVQLAAACRLHSMAAMLFDSDLAMYCSW